MDKRYQVFISSTFTDLKEERKAIIEGLLNAKYIPAGMEMFSASNDEQFEYIKKIIDTCDYCVLIIWARYGSINPSTGVSFTEQEYDYAVKKGIPVLVFMHSDPYNLPDYKREDNKRKKLENFRKKASKGRMGKLWNNKTDLVTSVILSLAEETINHPMKGWIRGDSQENKRQEVFEYKKDEKLNQNIWLDYLMDESDLIYEDACCSIVDFMKWCAYDLLLGIYIDDFDTLIVEKVYPIIIHDFDEEINYSIFDLSKQRFIQAMYAVGVMEFVTLGVRDKMLLTEKGKRVLRQILDDNFKFMTSL